MITRLCVALDLEMTGVRSDHDEVIEVGAVKFQGSRVLGTFQTLVRPEKPLPYRTQVFTGIQPGELDRAPRLVEVLGQVAKFVGDAAIVGHSVPHDLEFLARAGLRFPKNPVWDTFELASLLLPELSDYTLANVAAALGVRLSRVHRALDDAQISRHVLLALARRALDLDLGILSEINRLLSPFDWPARSFFEEAERTKARGAFENSIGAQLRAKMAPEELNLAFLAGGRQSEPELRPTEDRRPIALDHLQAAFAETGPFARRFAGFERREEQIHLATAIAGALNDGSHLVAEAGTGTGKSISYLLPALEFARANDRRVVISTNTINLQEQLVQKDVPDLRRTLAADPAYADTAEARVSVLKGRGNYLCLRRWAGLRRAEGLTLDEARVLVRILVWLPSTRTGDREELNLNPGETAVWNRVSAQADNCLASDCSFLQKGTCFLARVRRAAEGSHVVIVNHALLLADLATEGHLLPPYDHLIIDEAHHLEDQATQQFGFQIGILQVQDQLDRLADPNRPIGLARELAVAFPSKGLPAALRTKAADLVTSLIETVERARSRSVLFFGQLDHFLRAARDPKAGESDQRLRLTERVRRNPAWRDVELAWENLRLDLEGIHGALDSAAHLVDQAGDAIADEADLAQALSSHHQMIGQLRDRLSQAVVNPDPSFVYWLAAEGRPGQVLVAAAPLEVAEILDRELFSAKESVVLTSATLATDSGFGYVRDRLGLHEAREIQVGSPFNYAESTLLYVPTDIPEPGKPGYQKAVDQAIAELCLATGGRALVLLTSHSALRQTHAGIQRRLEKAGILVLGQAIDGSRRQVLHQFRTTERAVLLGTASFWEGVDIPGDALSVLVIAKLPFAVPSDPVFAARSELYHNPFEEYALPQAILKFRQGFGRLIRTRTDRGVVAVLDQRVLTRRYGSLLLAALPVCREVHGPAGVLPAAARRFLNESRVAGRESRVAGHELQA